MACFIQGDGLLVGFSGIAIQTPAAGVPEFHLEDASLADNEITVGVTVDASVEAVVARLQGGQGDRFFVLVTAEAFHDMPSLTL
ncbi:hypothetical protein D3C84_1091570 [compost metagenome]